MHQPVLLREVLDVLDPQLGDFVIDGTVDGGGHAAALLEKIGRDGTLIGIDQDPEMLALSRERFKKIGAQGSGAFPKGALPKNVTLVEGNYADLPGLIAGGNAGREREQSSGGTPFEKADCLLLDLGFSSAQLEAEGRGFSFVKDGPLAMTYSPHATPVKKLLKKLREEEIADIIFRYGGERMSRRIAKAIYSRERRRPIETTGELAETVRGALPGNYERGRIDRATRTFQALRIYANRELENLEAAIKKLPQIMKKGGRAGIITFHSLEDKIVKQEFQKLEQDGIVKKINKKPITATKEEIKKNPRGRSAKLRAILFI